MKGFTALLMASCCTALVAQAHAADFPSTIGKGEGDLNVVAWEGYADDAWVKPFEQQTGCKVHRKYVGSSDEMVALTRMGAAKVLILFLPPVMRR
ncbi:hypothetical protein WSS15_13720 [Acetobacter pasteurianus]|uniref:hypothetical protein n=1 Tax=Acetobacter pasteurianus TaxID=438 RepID=UPI0022C86ED5|nr:hypothetical protein [Acetobacter pasteurianus]GLH28722.1 hypothetical protein WSS15_13720 [Acetobacter pasteurianus]